MIPTEEQIIVKSGEYSDNYEEQVGFRDGARWIVSKLNTKPHVAEVVKCGDVNKPKEPDFVQQIGRIVRVKDLIPENIDPRKSWIRRNF